jgi:hypothetical protein
MGKKKKAYSSLVGKPEEMGPLGTSTYRWDDTIKMYLRETEWGGMH